VGAVGDMDRGKESKGGVEGKGPVDHSLDDKNERVWSHGRTGGVQESYRYRLGLERSGMTEREYLDSLERDCRDPPSVFRELKRWGEYKKNRPTFTEQYKPHVCGQCGWIARFQEKICGKCGRQMFVVKITKHRTTARSKRYDPKNLDDLEHSEGSGFGRLERGEWKEHQKTGKANRSIARKECRNASRASKQGDAQ
jgi:hypothetical protein